MGYKAAYERLYKYRDGHIASLLGETALSWFTSAFGSLAEMLHDFRSDGENREIAGNYATGTDDERTASNIRLDYVCGLRREIRKQYLSGPSGVYTDVTPFRHGVMSAHGGYLFDNALDEVLTRKKRGGGK